MERATPLPCVARIESADAVLRSGEPRMVLVVRRLVAIEMIREERKVKLRIRVGEVVNFELLDQPIDFAPLAEKRRYGNQCSPATRYAL